MQNSDRGSKNSFLYPHSRYRGNLTPEYLAFNAHLQDFAQRVSYISALETGGKLSAVQAYEQVKSLWQQLEHSKQALGIGEAQP
ncbi:MAG TPA: hypothetical protein DDZ80_22270 [Cyanobacteria bacterium UBA8803]|nr:hypothetical protein [Cyanobacteria bacterium UBA9273]HBL61054.1 hypothetical protein [Cyanobacteria bacterium UBA8803]